MAVQNAENGVMRPSATGTVAFRLPGHPAWRLLRLPFAPLAPVAPVEPARPCCPGSPEMHYILYTVSQEKTLNSCP